MSHLSPTPAQEMTIALEHHRAGRLAKADAIYRRLLTRHPNQPDLHHLHGLVEMSVGHIDEAIKFMRRAIDLNSENSDYHTNLGNALRRKNLNDEAIDSYNAALRLNPNIPETHTNLGNALADMGKIDEAIAAHRKAIELKPEFVFAYANLGNALRIKGLLQESIEVQRQAVRLQPNLAELHANMGLSLSENGQMDEGAEEYRESLRLKPNQPQSQSNFGDLLMKLGQIEAAVACFEAAVKFAPGDAGIGSNLVFALNFDSRCSAAEILSRHREWAARITPAIPPLFRRQDHAPDPNRKLRIGYVSANLCDHVIGRNMLPIFRHRNVAEFETFCYSSVRQADAITREFMLLSDEWRDITWMQDDAVARMVADDRIDILVDLSLQLPGGRLRAFGAKPAPIQIAFAGYPGTTGMTQMDYRLTDQYLDPPRESDAFYSEQSIRLPHSFWCYDPAAMGVAEGFDVAPLPAMKNGFITFGCLNSFHKVNAACLGLWAKTMSAVPKSRLILLAPPGKTRQWVLEQFQSHGVDPGRIEFVGRQSRGDYLRTYDRIDLGLDSLPYNGHTTSLDSIWMGVPVVTLVGKTVVGRAGFSQLSNLNLAQLVARDADEFVRIVSATASDVSVLATVRAGLRERMLRSPLTDATRFAADIESVYRQVWRTWCQRTQ